MFMKPFDKNTAFEIVNTDCIFNSDELFGKGIF